MFFILFLTGQLNAQTYTSYFTGSSNNITSNPQGGVCLMGGATENDNAMKWFLSRADGGDILVLRASGSDGYNDYFYEQLGVELNSVESIVFHEAAASNEEYIQDKINQAEAIWFAGGDQWKYISYWKGTVIDTLIRKAVSERNIVIGGTSAGMAILGQHVFSAMNGTVTSEEVLANPFHSDIHIASDFLMLDFLKDVVTDTHYDNPDRKGRHMVFMAHALLSHGSVRGIACDEYTSVCIDESGIAKVFGAYPEYDDNAYFLQVNCNISENVPEVWQEGKPITWNKNKSAIKVYKVKGTTIGINHFDMNNWTSGSGGFWENWSIEQGVLNIEESEAPNCISNNANTLSVEMRVFPNPSTGVIHIKNFENTRQKRLVEIRDLSGRLLRMVSLNPKGTIDISDLGRGVYIIKTIGESALLNMIIISQ